MEETRVVLSYLVLDDVIGVRREVKRDLFEDLPVHPFGPAVVLRG